MRFFLEGLFVNNGVLRVNLNTVIESEIFVSVQGGLSTLSNNYRGFRLSKVLPLPFVRRALEF